MARCSPLSIDPRALRRPIKGQVTDSGKIDRRNDFETDLARFLGKHDMETFTIIAVDKEGRRHTTTSKHIQPFVDEGVFMLAGEQVQKAHETAAQGRIVALGADTLGFDDLFQDMLPNSSISDALVAGGTATKGDRLVIPQQARLSAPRELLREESLMPAVAMGDMMDDAQPEPVDEEVDMDDEEDGEPTELQADVTRTASFYVHDEEAVKSFLLSRISKLHQLSDKKIAKAWIKGICPKKQAHFPYQNKQREDQGLDPEVPGWWPPRPEGTAASLESLTEEEQKEARENPQCYRNYLLLRLLRLRPEPEQLRSWNKETSEPNKTHQEQGWTAFLKELAPVESLDDVSPTQPKRIQERRDLFTQLYEVAEMEEYYNSSKMDQQYQYQTELPPKVSKRKRATASRTATGNDDPASRTTTPSRGERHAPAKFVRHSATDRASVARATLPIETSSPAIRVDAKQKADERDSTQQRRADDCLKSERSSVSATSRRRATDTQVRKPKLAEPVPGRCQKDVERRRAKMRSLYRGEAPGKEHALRQQHQAIQNQHRPDRQQMQWQAKPAYNTAGSVASLDNSCSSATTLVEPFQQSMNDAQPPFAGQSFFPGDQHYNFPLHYQEQTGHASQGPAAQAHAVHVYNTIHTPQPQFAAVPNTPALSSNGLIYSQDFHTGDMQNTIGMPDLPMDVTQLNQQQQQQPDFPLYEIEQHDLKPENYQDAPPIPPHYFPDYYGEAQYDTVHVQPPYHPQMGQAGYHGLPLGYSFGSNFPAARQASALGWE